MNYYWFCSIDKDSLRSMGANHIHAVSWNGRDGFQLGEQKFWSQGFVFTAEKSFELFVKLKTDLLPVGLSERQYKRIIRGELVKSSSGTVAEQMNRLVSLTRNF